MTDVNRAFWFCLTQCLWNCAFALSDMVAVFSQGELLE